MLELVQTGSEFGAVVTKQFFPLLLTKCASSNLAVRQTCAFGIAHAIQGYPQLFATNELSLSSALQALKPLLVAPTAASLREANELGVPEEDLYTIFDNAIMALGRVLQEFGAHSSRPILPGAEEAAMFQHFLGALPVRHDEEEARNCSAILADLIERRYAGL